VDLFKYTFESINKVEANPPVISLISFAISTTGTVIWYDHWEDGYENDVRNPVASTTQVWGDGDSSNGCHPNVSSCTDSNDRLVAGDSVVIQNTVQIGNNNNPSRNKNDVFFDGADRIQSSFPIAVTRAAYPQDPGSLMAGGVEVLDTSLWGKSFQAPVGRNIAFETDGFEYSALYVMAGEDDTNVYIKGSSKPTTLSMGESIHVLVNQGDTITSDKFVQVDLLTGDIDSKYELRWYSLRGTEDWSDKYLSPMGDTAGGTKLVVYNPNTFSIDVKITVKDGDVTKKIDGGKHLVSDNIKTGSAALIEETNGNNFFVLTVTDTIDEGRLFDWGFPVVAVRDLTPQVLVGLGFGCTDNWCRKESYNNYKARSVVWVSPMEDADIYVDFDNDGVVDKTYQVNYLNSRVIQDWNDKDMSGAIIFATKKDSGAEGEQVNFAAAWGQDPSKSGSMDESALDLGTLVVPFNGIQVSKQAELVDDNDNNGEISPGDKIMYTIIVSNVGQQDIPTGAVNIKDTLDAAVTYVADSLEYNVPETGEKATITGSSFPLAGDGLPSQFPFLKRGGTAEISFEVVINDGELISEDGAIYNNGSVSFGSAGKATYGLRTVLKFEADIDIEKTVYMGHNGKVSCNGEELVTGTMDDLITYCFEVTNNGSSYLKDVAVSDSVVGFTTDSIGVLAPGQKKTVFMQTTLTGDVTSDAEATGVPTFPDGKTTIPSLEPVKASDPAGVELRVAKDEEAEYLCL
jgi:uncharacterized repeat protein (TIGR01451 family)